MELSGTVDLNTAVDAEFKLILDRYIAAWNTNAITPATFYSEDADAVYYDIFLPLAGYKGWKEFGASARAFFDAGGRMEITPYPDLQVKQSGDIVWTTMTFHLVVQQSGNEPTELDCRQTIIWEKHGKTWRIVHEHDSAPFPKSGEP